MPTPITVISIMWTSKVEALVRWLSSEIRLVTVLHAVCIVVAHIRASAAIADGHAVVVAVRYVFPANAVDLPVECAVRALVVCIAGTVDWRD
jgi:hypothetical protein